MSSGEYSLSDSDSEPDLVNTLLDRLCRSMVESKFEKTEDDFLPRDAFQDILADLRTHERDRHSPSDTILQLMQIDPEAAKDNDRALANYILDDAKTILLIAVYTKLKHKQLRVAMNFFKKHDFNDSCLPIAVWPKEQLKHECHNHPFVHMECQGNKMKRNPVWSVNTIDSFQKEQWKFLAPIISTSKENHEFGPCILPFTEKGSTPESGAHGIVYQYTIHPAHLLHDHCEDRLHLERTPNHVFAVKAFKQNGEKVILDWEREVNALAEMNRLGQDHIVRFITAFTRGKEKYLEHYVVFEWADGGNLGDFWTGKLHDLWAGQRKPMLTTSLINWVIMQLQGLARALVAAHNLEDGASYRHGDLKPANILWFPDRTGTGGYGTLKIGDWGEAKKNKHVTSLRHFQGLNTTAKFGTRRYEPPETGLQSSLPKGTKHVRSRLYDIWGVGCITLEFIIWLLYGCDGLKEFNDEDYGSYGHFYEFGQPGGPNVHRVVVYWMEHMSKDILCRPDETPLGDLLRIVRTGLLVISLPDDGGPGAQDSVGQNNIVDESGLAINIIEAESTEPVVVHETVLKQSGRFRATELAESLQQISETGKHGYWHQNHEPKPAPVGYNNSHNLLAPPTTHKTKPESTGLQAPETNRVDYGHISLDPEVWSIVPDSETAARLFPRMEDTRLNPAHQNSPRAKLCTKCRGFCDALPTASPSISFTTQALQQSADTRNCQLCYLLWRTYQANSDRSSTTVEFYREGSILRISGAKHAALTLSRSNGKPAR